MDCPVCREEFSTNELLTKFFDQLRREYCLKHYHIKYGNQQHPSELDLKRMMWWEQRFIDMGWSDMYRPKWGVRINVYKYAPEKFVRFYVPPQ